jgi:CubicO group peptidase (beta-lactamase class C family)
MEGPYRAGVDVALVVDEVFDRFYASGRVPAMAYGVVADGALVHARGVGSLGGTAGPPDADTVFRIASMTKSFTASAVLLLRDQGRLRLDDPIAALVPELAGLRLPTSDSPPLTVRLLLEMSAGFATDDPWGDRQQALPADRFSNLLAGGFSFAWPPGTAFEYSNLGYAILGRAVENVTGLVFREAIQRLLLDPLGLTSTVFDAGDVPAERLATGHVARNGQFDSVPFETYGSFASMGGLFSSVRDLARWIAGFLDAFPPRDDPESGHPLRRATRREQQQVHRSIGPMLTVTAPGAPPVVATLGYGFGLVVRHDHRIGDVVAHSGGYPGFGSHMRWHPACGVGVVALGNVTYAPMHEPVADALTALVQASPERRRPAPWPEALAARDALEGLLARWDDEVAARLFTENVALDEPLTARASTMAELAERHGPLRRDDGTDEARSPAHLAWWLRGERGAVRAELRMSPERRPRVQAFAFVSAPPPPTALVDLAARLVAETARPDPRWPDGVAWAPANRPAVEHALRAVSSWWGACRLGRVTKGDGRHTASFAVHGERPWASPLAGDRPDLELRLELGDGDTTVTVVFAPLPLEPLA